jgi:hypothetical protein
VEDLEEETRVTLIKECKGCAEIFQEPIKTGGKRTRGKENKPMTKKTQTQVVKQREPRHKSQKDRYNFSDEEEDLSDTDDEIPAYLCVSADPRRSGSAEGGENFILTAEELRLSLQVQCQEEDQTVWLTTAQTGFPTTDTEGELDNILDHHLGKPTARCLHPAISAYILQRQQELLSQHRAPSMTETRVMELEREWDTQEPHVEVPNRSPESGEDTTWELNPLPLMVQHPPRITVSNTKIQLEEGILSQPYPKGENDLGWIQLQQKSLLWREKIEGSSVITHEDLTTMAHSARTGWTIMSGTWNHRASERSGVPPQAHYLRFRPLANLKSAWKKQMCLLPRDTSFLP